MPRWGVFTWNADIYNPWHIPDDIVVLANDRDLIHNIRILQADLEKIKMEINPELSEQKGLLGQKIEGAQIKVSTHTNLLLWIMDNNHKAKNTSLGNEISQKY